jgi:hypothetical protein
MPMPTTTGTADRTIDATVPQLHSSPSSIARTSPLHRSRVIDQRDTEDDPMDPSRATARDCLDRESEHGTGTVPRIDEDQRSCLPEPEDSGGVSGLVTNRQSSRDKTTNAFTFKGSTDTRSAFHAQATSSGAAFKPTAKEVHPNPLLDISRLRVPSKGRGVLQPGALFRGTQTSGRSSYEVEVRILVSVARATGSLTYISWHSLSISFRFLVRSSL